MTTTDKKLLEELEAELEGKVQKAMLAAYLKEPTSESVLKVALRLVDKGVPKNESS